MGKSPKPSPKKDAPVAVDAHVMERKAAVELFAKEMQFAKFLQPHILQYSLQIAKVLVFLQFTVLPMAVAAFQYLCQLWVLAKPHLTGENMNDLVPAICGLGLCLFGGTFPLLIAAVEAFRLAGYEGMKIAILELWEEGEKAIEAHKKDEETDKDGDGTPDVQQQQLNEKLARKALLILRVVNPDKITSAITYLNTGLLAVLASLKMSFARAITLGATIGVLLRKQFDKFLGPKLMAVVPQEYQKWVPPAVDYAIKIIAVTIAFALQNIISAVHSALRGGHMLGSGLVTYLKRTGKMQSSPEETQMDEIVGYGAAAFGFLWQLSMGFGLMFPLNLLLLPVTFVESILSFAIALF